MPKRRLRSFALVLCIALASGVAHAGTPRKPGPHSPRLRATQRLTRTAHASKTTAKKKKSYPRGQQSMNAKRVRQIQAALIREKYLKGRADGVWDQRSQAAIAHFQSDNGWQSKVVPDARALIKLGLGPEYAGLINPDTAVISFASRRSSLTWPSGSER